MKALKSKATAQKESSEDEIRDYAQHLFEQSGRVLGRDLDNWLEAKACLQANIPKQHAHRRLHRQQHPEEFATVEIATINVESEPAFDPLETSERSVQVAGMVVLHPATANRHLKAGKY
jgi:hypothetical protein